MWCHITFPVECQAAGVFLHPEPVTQLMLFKRLRPDKQLHYFERLDCGTSAVLHNYENEKTVS